MSMNFARMLEWRPSKVYWKAWFAVSFGFFCAGVSFMLTIMAIAALLFGMVPKSVHEIATINNAVVLAAWIGSTWYLHPIRRNTELLIVAKDSGWILACEWNPFFLISQVSFWILQYLLACVFFAGCYLVSFLPLRRWYQSRR